MPLSIACPDAEIAATLTQHMNAPSAHVAIVLQRAGEDTPAIPADVQYVLWCAARETLPTGLPNVPMLRVELPMSLRDLPTQLHTLLAMKSPASFTLADGWMYDASSKMLRSGAQQIMFTEKEAAMLEALYAAQPHTIARETLLQQVWQFQAGVDTHTLETHMYRLRQKLKEALGEREIIITAPEGYRLNI